MNNAAPRRLFEEGPGDDESSLAPVIPLKSVTEKSETKKAKTDPVKTGLKKSTPDFTGPVFKPKKHDML
jgi:hypothetical protein